MTRMSPRYSLTGRRRTMPASSRPLGDIDLSGRSYRASGPATWRPAVIDAPTRHSAIMLTLRTLTTLLPFPFLPSRLLAST
jgi:hypothetical protein